MPDDQPPTSPSSVNELMERARKLCREADRIMDEANQLNKLIEKTKAAQKGANKDAPNR